MRQSRVALVALVPLLIGLAGCTSGGDGNASSGTVQPLGSGGASPSSSSGGSSTSGTVGSPTKAPVPAPSSSGPAAAGVAKFGETVTQDKISITVSPPVTQKSSDNYVMDREGQKIASYTMVEVTVKNDSDKPLTAISVDLEATSGDTQVSKVFDSGGGVSRPTADILPGKTLKWKEGFSVDLAKPLDVQVSANFKRFTVFSK